jgi:uncharacterized protein YciI
MRGAPKGKRGEVWHGAVLGGFKTMNILWFVLVAAGALAGQASSPAPPAAPATPPAAVPDFTAFHAVTLELGPKWDRTRSVREQVGIREHGEYMSRLSSEGKIVLGGPFLEGAPPSRATGAIVFYATADPAEARRLAEADPGIKGGLFTVGAVRRFVVGAGAWRPWKRPAP